jgi:hypothetical protein
MDIDFGLWRCTLFFDNAPRYFEADTFPFSGQYCAIKKRVLDLQVKHYEQWSISSIAAMCNLQYRRSEANFFPLVALLLSAE